jgi:hypothetical protein
LSGLSSLPLEHLDLSHNALTTHESLGILELCKGTLKEVNILFNPFDDDLKAVFTLAKTLPKLIWLNHMPRTKFSHYQDKESETNIITEDMLR